MLKDNSNITNLHKQLILYFHLNLISDSNKSKIH